jgi:multiple sugar transport system permease protein
MVRRMTFKQFLFVLPLLVVVGAFSLYPIVSSFAYTVFDYRVFDQRYNEMRLSGAFNAGLFAEDCGYLARNLSEDMTLLDDASAAEFAALQSEIEAYLASAGEQKGARGISPKEAASLDAFLTGLEQKIAALYAAHPDTPFYYAGDMPILLAEMRTCFIEPNYSGTANYARLFGDERFFAALGTTVFFMAVSVTCEFVLGLALAMVMNQAIRGIGLVRTVSLIPWAIPTAVSALIWSYLYDGSSGVVSHLFAAIGLAESPQSMLLTAAGAMGSAILADVWKTTPYMALLLLAGLQIIDRGLYESSSIDGSGPVSTFFRITLPLMKPSILVALLFRMLDAFRVYDLLAILTNGRTESLSVYSYQLMIGQGNYGYGSVVVVAMFACVALIAFFFVKVMGAEIISNEER